MKKIVFSTSLPACSNMRLENETYMLDFFPQKVCMCNWGLNSEPGSHLVFSLDFFTKMPVKLAKRRPPVVRPFLHKYMGPKGYQKRPWRTGFIPWWHPRVKNFVWDWLYLRLCFAKLCNFPLKNQRTICYFLDFFWRDAFSQ